MPDAPYAGPFYPGSDPRGPDRSPYLRGVKRGLSRWDDKVLPWAVFDDHFNRRLEHAARVFQAAHGIDATGNWGRGSHDALEFALRNRGHTTPHEPALDKTALMLMEDGYDLKHPPVVVSPLEKVRDEIAAYLRLCETYRSLIHYRQQRPMRSLGDNPAGGFQGDCSELAVAAYYWARLRTGIHVPDPSGYGYAGYGNSVTLYTTNRYRKVSTVGVFEVGDVATYGLYASRHVTICRARGTATTAVWTSHGSEYGPNPTRLFYRTDLWTVVRPRLTP